MKYLLSILLFSSTAVADDWHPVSEEAPDNERMLVISQPSWSKSMILFAQKNGKCWANFDGYEISGWAQEEHCPVENITHWMRIPDLPQSVKDADESYIQKRLKQEEERLRRR